MIVILNTPTQGKKNKQTIFASALACWLLGKQSASRVQSSDKAQSETRALSLDHHVTGLRRPHTIISCAKAEGPVGATAAGSRRDESWSVKHAGRKSGGVENKKTAQVALFLCLRDRNFLIGPLLSDSPEC